jgi:PKD repeat protein
MKKILLLISLLFFVLICFAQVRPHDCYFDEEQGYFMNPVKVEGGLVFTDNYCNSVYYFHNGNLSKIADSPGCGRYFTVSPNGENIAYKYIDNGHQSPAIYNLVSGRTELLANKPTLCGQPVMFENGVAYTIDEDLYIVIDNITSKYFIGDYINFVAVSNDAKYVSYASNDIIYLKNLISGNTVQISNTEKMSAYPQFSPDGTKILYQSGNIFVYEILTQKTFDCGGGLAPKWSPNSEQIVFYQAITEEFSVINSDIFTCNYKDGEHIALTNSSDIAEMNPRFVSEQEIIFDTYTGREIVSLNLVTGIETVLFDFDGILDISFTNITSSKSEVLISGTVPYTHQVYDTPDSHYGYGSCAPTTAIMAVAYYNKLPKWPTLVTKLYPHISDYGSYVSTRYRFNEHYFEENTTTSGGDVAYGGYGYMWGLGSPYSQMRNYMALHYFESVQEWNSSIVFADVLAEIDAGYPLPMCVMLSSAGHLILAKGYIENQHTLIFSDPYGDKNTPSWPSYDGHKAYYDWPGYNNGYENLDYNGSYGVIAWTVTAHADEVVYNDTIIDNVFYHHGFEMNNSENGSQMRYFRDQNSGYNGHSWWTMTEATSDDICWVQWIPELTEDGYYRVSAYIPSANASAENAPYRITHSGGTDIVLVDQADFNDEWVDLGVYHFETGDDFRVYLGDSTGIGSQPICYDAVWFEFIPAPVAAFETADLSVCVNETVVFTNLSTNASLYEWEISGENIQTSSETNPEFNFDEPGIYSVKLKAIGPYETDSVIMESLITVFANPIASFSVSSNNAYLPDAYVCFINESSNASTYLWDFGNGQSSSELNPFVLYFAEGSYFVTLSAANEGCLADVFELENPVVVHGPLSVDNQTAGSIKVFPNPASDVLFVESDSEILSLEIFNILGKSVLQRNGSGDYININHLSEGLYKVIVKTAESQNEYKIVVKR